MPFIILTQKPTGVNLMGNKETIKQMLKEAKKCKKCGGLLEPKFGDYHPICNPENAVTNKEVRT